MRYKRFLSLLLTFSMCLQLLNTPAIAATLENERALESQSEVEAPGGTQGTDGRQGDSEASEGEATLTAMEETQSFASYDEALSYAENNNDDAVVALIPPVTLHIPIYFYGTLGEAFAAASTFGTDGFTVALLDEVREENEVVFAYDAASSSTRAMAPS